MHCLLGILLQRNSEEPGEDGLVAALNACIRKLNSFTSFVKFLLNSRDPVASLALPLVTLG